MDRVLCLQHVPFEGPARLRDVFADHGLSIEVHPVHERPDLPDPRDFRMVVATGGPMSVNDHDAHPWLAAEKRWLREAIATRVPVLGICLGSQLIAAALGAAVRPNGEREVGWFPLQAAVDDPLTAALCMPPRVLHWHGERWDLPAGARLLAGSAACDHQAFAIGDRVLGLQFHLEMDRPASQALIENCPDDLAPGTWVQSAEAMLDAATDFDAAYSALVRVFDVWSASWRGEGNRVRP